MRVVQISQYGGPEVLQPCEMDAASPAPGQVSIKQTYAGLNFIDIYLRTGVYPVDSFPAILGMEGAGEIVAVGEGVGDFAIGDRVTYPMSQGAYAQERLIDASKVVAIPDSINDETAAAMMLKGLTAYYLLFRTYPVKAGDAILVYAAAGGVGSLLCQWGKYLGATVIGCVGNEEKAELARKQGCDHTILYHQEDIAGRVKALTDGKGVHVAYDAVGQATFEASLHALRPFGTLVSYGNASGVVEPFTPGILAPLGSLYVTRPTLATHIATRQLLTEATDTLFEAVGSGIISIDINQRWPLDGIQEAHRALEAGETTGCSVLEL